MFIPAEGRPRIEREIDFMKFQARSSSAQLKLSLGAATAYMVPQSAYLTGLFFTNHDGALTHRPLPAGARTIYCSAISTMKPRLANVRTAPSRWRVSCISGAHQDAAARMDLRIRTWASSTASKRHGWSIVCSTTRRIEQS